MNFMKNRLRIGLGTGAALVLVFVYLIFYAPLMKRLATDAHACRLAEGEVKDARNMIQAFKAREIEKSLLSDLQVSDMLEQITRHGNQIGVTFLAVTSHTSEEGEHYRILPIDMELESAYESLGQFLGDLDDLKGSLITVKDFVVTPRKEDPLKLDTRLTLNVYLNELNEALHAG